ncbi:MAG: L,D-transpeptidase family protein [Gammaproteobacteria bacterium]
MAVRDFDGSIMVGRARAVVSLCTVLFVTGLAPGGAGQATADIATPSRAEPSAGEEAHLPADELVVRKGERKLYLLREGQVLRSYDIALGQQPEGHKQREGDSRTPEGSYRIDWRKSDSEFFLALHISYPNDRDVRNARRRGLDPGGQIMIHGLPNEPRYPRRQYLWSDWTDGCIAVSNAAMIDLWVSVPDDTPITILP